MPESRDWTCPFCRMKTTRRLLRVPLCPICLEQSNDFLWVSAVQVLLLATGAISGVFFVIEELLLFFVLIAIKHRLPSVLDRFVDTHSAKCRDRRVLHVEPVIPNAGIFCPSDIMVAAILYQSPKQRYGRAVFQSAQCLDCGDFHIFHRVAH